MEQEALDELSSTEASLSPLAAAVVSVESQLSCSVASVGPVEAAAEPAAGVLALEDGAASVAASVSDVVFVHWRAFFLRVNRLIRPGSLKKMLFLTRSPLTWECSMVTRQARGAVPLRISFSPLVWMTWRICLGVIGASEKFSNTMRAASAQVRSFFLFCLSFISSSPVSAANLLSVYKAKRWRCSCLAKWLTTLQVLSVKPKQAVPSAWDGAMASAGI